MKKALTRALVLFAILVGIVQHMPQALAFPYVRTVQGVKIESTAPIPDAIEAEIARATALDVASPLRPLPPRRVFLTDGGWRWRLLAFPLRYAMGFSRPFSNAIIINRSSIDQDAVWSGGGSGRPRHLSSVIAHETTHLMIYHRYGLRALAFPRWKVEGYADHVAQESGLSDADASRLRATGLRTQALFYYDARRRVEQTLATGVTVDQLFRGS